MVRAAVLLVDDDEMSSQILSYILVDEKYDVDLASTGTTAIEKIAEKEYDLVLLDYILPDMRGHEVAEKMKKLRPRLRIILLTGYTNNDDPANPNYLQVLIKPVPPDTIVKTIAEILS